MTARGKATVCLVLAFVLGLAVGALGLGVYLASTGGRLPFSAREPFPVAMLRRLSRELDLRPEQRAQIEAVLRETGQDFSRLREELRPRFREIRAHSRERIAALLDRDQQARFTALTAEWEQRGERGWR